jgi:L-fuculose-phosphate aldolase
MDAQEAALRDEIALVCRRMYDKDLISADAGNVSARLAPNRILITPSRIHKGFIRPEQLLVVDDDGETVGGAPGKPTSELPMHLEAYRQRPDVGAVVHAHPPTAVALSIAGIPLDEYVLPEVIVTLGRIPTTPYAMPSSSENAAAIRSLIREHDALVLQRHGSLTVGATPLAAFSRLETVEQQARICYMLATLGVADPTLALPEVGKLLALRERLGLLYPQEWRLFRSLGGEQP